MKKPLNKSIKKDIAIIGLSGKFPKSESIDAFWENLINKKELIHFYLDEQETYGGYTKNITDISNFINAFGSLEKPDSFDYSFFGYTKDEAIMMDPQIRMIHELAWTALEDSGNIPKDAGSCGVFLSASDNLNWRIHSLVSKNEKINPFYLSQITNKNFISTLLSFNLDLNGPSYLIDTACSSTLAAVHIACRNLLLKECSLALAGGVNINSSKNIGYQYKEGMIFSTDGHCRAFDEKSTGTVSGEGGGIVVLKRLEDAINDKDHIYAVIRASSVNNDGNRKVGYTAPSIKGQYDCIKKTYQIAQVSSDSITYVEAHGTGTKLGDPIEIEALNKAFDFNKEHKCAIGSVKTNIGHLDVAAGIAGLIKVVKSIKHKQIPPTLHYKTPNPNINFDEGPFYVNNELMEWENIGDTPLRAGVSSFGIGGTNVHLLVEEPSKIEKDENSRPLQLILLSASTPTALKEYKSKLLEFIKRKDAISIADLGYTLNVGRTPFKYRNYFVSSNRNNLAINLANRNTEVVYSDSKNKNIVFMFPGQGSQYFGMARDIYLNEPYFKSIFDEGIHVLESLSNENFYEIIGYSSNLNIDKEKINDTVYTQPLLFLTEYALAKLLIKWGIHPNLMIGHSLGEYVAACISEVFSFEEGLKLVLKRAQLMSKIDEGSMVSIGKPEIDIIPMLNDNLSIAAVNTDDSCVISGNKKDIDKLKNKLSEMEISFIELKTSRAFHSVMMDDTVEGYKKELSLVNLSPPKYPFISNVSGKEVNNIEVTTSEYWIKHLRQTVKFSEGLGTILEKGDSIFIEVGSGKTLLNFIKRNKKNDQFKNEVVNLFNTTKEGVETEYEQFISAIGSIWSKGVSVNWDAYYENEQRCKISAPTYCFNRTSLPVRVNPLEQINLKNIIEKEKISDWFYIPVWKRDFTNSTLKKNKVKSTYLLFSDGGVFINCLSQRLKEKGEHVIEITKGNNFLRENDCFYSIDPYKEDSMNKLFNEFELQNLSINQIIYHWTFIGCKYEVLETAVRVLQSLLSKVIGYQSEIKKNFTFLTISSQKVQNNDNVIDLSSFEQKLVDICSQENPLIHSNWIDIDDDSRDNLLLSNVISELDNDKSFCTIAFRKNKKWSRDYDAINLEGLTHSKLKYNGIYILTGGLGYVGVILSKYLLQKYKAKVILLGRGDIYNVDQSSNLSDNYKFKLSEIEKLKKEYGNIYYYQADVSDYSSFSKCIELIESEHKCINGVLHLAGNVNLETFKSVESLTQQDIQDQFEPKLKGTLNIYEIFKNKNLDFVWVSSSLSTIVGGLTSGAYAVANNFIDHFVNYKKDELLDWFCVNLDGIEESGQYINKNELVEIFEKSFLLDEYPQLIISVKNMKRRINEILEKKISSNEETFKKKRPDLNEDYVIPKTFVQSKLADIFQDLLGILEIGILDGFFDLGGDSLKGMTLQKKIHKEFGMNIKLEDIYKNSTIEKLAYEIEIIRNLEMLNKEKEEKSEKRHIRL